MFLGTRRPRRSVTVRDLPAVSRRSRGARPAARRGRDHDRPRGVRGRRPGLRRADPYHGRGRGRGARAGSDAERDVRHRAVGLRGAAVHGAGRPAAGQGRGRRRRGGPPRLPPRPRGGAHRTQRRGPGTPRARWAAGASTASTSARCRCRGATRRARPAPGVTVYVLDTGVDATPPRVRRPGVAAVNTIDDPDGDCDGHGTVVAGIAASHDHGVAKDAQVRSVKVLDCTGSGTLSSLLAGIDYVARTAAARGRPWRSCRGATGLRRPRSRRWRARRQRRVRRGVGRQHRRDDCEPWPREHRRRARRRATPRSTTGASPAPARGPASTSTPPAPGDLRPCPAAGPRSYTGTSMAAPHAAGVAALYKQTFGDAPSAVVQAWIVDNATPDVLAGGVDRRHPEPAPLHRRPAELRLQLREARVRHQRLRQADRAVGLLALLQDRHQRAPDRQARSR